MLSSTTTLKVEIPKGLPYLIHKLSKAIIRVQPDNIYEFAATFLEHEVRVKDLLKQENPENDKDPPGKYSARNESGKVSDFSHENAATKIQAGFRGYKTRKDIKMAQMRTNDEEIAMKLKPPLYTIQEEEEAATKIQAGVRGYLVRKKMKNSMDMGQSQSVDMSLSIDEPGSYIGDFIEDPSNSPTQKEFVEQITTLEKRIEETETIPAAKSIDNEILLVASPNTKNLKNESLENVAVTLISELTDAAIGILERNESKSKELEKATTIELVPSEEFTKIDSRAFAKEESRSVEISPLENQQHNADVSPVPLETGSTATASASENDEVSQTPITSQEKTPEFELGHEHTSEAVGMQEVPTEVELLLGLVASDTQKDALIEENNIFKESKDKIGNSLGSFSEAIKSLEQITLMKFETDQDAAIFDDPESSNNAAEEFPANVIAELSLHSENTDEDIEGLSPTPVAEKMPFSAAKAEIEVVNPETQVKPKEALAAESQPMPEKSDLDVPVQRRSSKRKTGSGVEKYRSGIVMDDFQILEPSANIHDLQELNELDAEIESEAALLNNAAARIQAGFRGFQVRRGLNNAATRIQSNYRGYKTRKELRNQKNAAVKIQATVRGFLTRKQILKSKAQKLEQRRSSGRRRSSSAIHRAPNLATTGKKVSEG